MASNTLLLNFIAIFYFLSLLSTTVITRGCAICASKTPPPAVTPSPVPVPVPAPAATTCSTDTLKLGVCVDLLGLVKLPQIGTPPSSSCCALIEGLADLEAAVCLCTAIKANVLGVNLDVPVTLSSLISACNKTVPPRFTCA